MQSARYSLHNQNFDRMYGRVVEETDEYVVLVDNGKKHKLQRCRMYNSHLVGDMLYTDYADKEYVQTYSSTGKGSKEPRPAEDQANKEKRIAAAKKSWETRRGR